MFYAFNLYYQEHGIHKQFSVVDTPKQKYCLKNKNQTLIGVEFYMLINDHLLKIFWGKDLLTTNYL